MTTFQKQMTACFFTIAALTLGGCAQTRLHPFLWGSTDGLAHGNSVADRLRDGQSVGYFFSTNSDRGLRYLILDGDPEQKASLGVWRGWLVACVGAHFRGALLVRFPDGTVQAGHINARRVGAYIDTHRRKIWFAYQREQRRRGSWQYTPRIEMTQDRSWHGGAVATLWHCRRMRSSRLFRQWLRACHLRPYR